MPVIRLVTTVFVATLLWAGSAHGDASAEQRHSEGVSAFRKSDFAAARSAFENALKSDPDNASALYNLGLVEYRSGNEGRGIGLWRKALSAHPSYTPAAHALRWAEARLPRLGSNRDPGFWEEFRSFLLAPIPLDRYLLLTALLFFLTGWTTLRYLGNRRRAILDEKPMPPFPSTAMVAMGLFVVAILLSAAKAYDATVVRGTILADRVAVQTTPDTSSATLFDLFEGFEVVVRQSHENWLMVTLPGGLTGWIPKEAVYISSKSRGS